MGSTEWFPNSAAKKWVNLKAGSDIEADEAKIWVAGILVLVFVQYFLISKKFYGSKRKPALPPGPRNWPLIGAMFSMETNLARCYTKLAKRFGPIFYYRLGSHSIVVVSSVEGVKEVLKTKDSQFGDRPNKTIMKTAAQFLGFESQDILFSSTDDHLKILKKACTTEFFVASKLAAYENVRRHEAATMVEEISWRVQHSATAGQGKTLNMRESLLLTSTNIICSLVFGKRYSDAILSETDEFRRFPALVDQFTLLIHKFNLVDLFPWLEWLDPQRLGVQYRAFQRDCRKCYGQLLEEHRAVRKSVRNYQDKDFVDLLLTLHESGKITADGIYGCLMDMMAGGVDTNSITTEWALLELIKNPESLAKLQKEIDEVVGSDRPVEESDFTSMPYLQAVIKETFRLHTPAPLLVPHFTKFASSLGGFYVPANTTVFMNMFAISRDPLLWENPEQFIPERFLGSRHSDVTNVTGSTYLIVPFGGGRRMCPASNLGLLLVQRALTTLVHAFDLSPPPGVGVDDISAMEGGITLEARPKDPLMLSATPRLAATVYSTTRLQSP